MPTSAASMWCPARSTTSPAAMSLPTCSMEAAGYCFQMRPAAVEAEQRSGMSCNKLQSTTRRATCMTRQLSSVTRRAKTNHQNNWQPTRSVSSHLPHIVPRGHRNFDAHALSAVGARTQKLRVLNLHHCRCRQLVNILSRVYGGMWSSRSSLIYCRSLQANSKKPLFPPTRIVLCC